MHACREAKRVPRRTERAACALHAWHQVGWRRGSCHPSYGPRASRMACHVRTAALLTACRRSAALHCALGARSSVMPLASKAVCSTVPGAAASPSALQASAAVAGSAHRLKHGGVLGVGAGLVHQLIVHGDAAAVEALGVQELRRRHDHSTPQHSARRVTACVGWQDSTGGPREREGLCEGALSLLVWSPSGRARAMMMMTAPTACMAWPPML